MLIQKVCYETMELAGYRLFRTESELRNLKIPNVGAFTILKDLKDADLGVVKKGDLYVVEK